MVFSLGNWFTTSSTLSFSFRSGHRAVLDLDLQIQASNNQSQVKSLLLINELRSVVSGAKDPSTVNCNACIR